MQELLSFSPLWTGCCLMFVYGCSAWDCCRRTRRVVLLCDENACSTEGTSEGAKTKNSESGYYAHVLTEMARIWRLNNSNSRFAPWYHAAMLCAFNSKSYKVNQSSPWSDGRYASANWWSHDATSDKIYIESSITNADIPWIYFQVGEESRVVWWGNTALLRSRVQT